MLRRDRRMSRRGLCSVARGGERAGRADLTAAQLVLTGPLWTRTHAHPAFAPRTSYLKRTLYTLRLEPHARRVGRLPLPVRDVRIELRTQRGGICALEASVRRRPKCAWQARRTDTLLSDLLPRRCSATACMLLLLLLGCGSVIGLQRLQLIVG